LLQASALDNIAAGIQWNSQFSDPDEAFRQVSLADKLPEYSPNGITAPPLNDLPPSLQALIPAEPLRATITAIDKRKKGQDMMVEVNLGTNDGLVMNMPLCSPAGSPRYTKGWGWHLDAERCKIGLSDDSDIPQIGDVLVARDPAAGPLL
jgi:hypothetical protein